MSQKRLQKKMGYKSNQLEPLPQIWPDFPSRYLGGLFFLTEGPSRKVKIRNQEIIFRKTTSKVMAAAGTREGLIVQAFKNLGKEHIDRLIRARTRKFLAPSGVKIIRKNLRYAPAWIRSLVFEIDNVLLVMKQL